MAHDVFVSHSTKDKVAADAVVAHLERHGLRCWCAPRDIVPGTSWATSIVQGITGCRAMVVVFSENANKSDHIRREVERAVSHGVPVVPLRIEDVMPHGDLEYFLSSSHWLDAITQPVERHLDQLAKQLKALMAAADGAPIGTAGLPTTAVWSTPSKSSRRWVIGVAAAVVVIALAVGMWLMNRPRDVAAGAKGPTEATKPLVDPAPPPDRLPVVEPKPVLDPRAIPASDPSLVVLPTKRLIVAPNPPVVDPSAKPGNTIAQDNDDWHALTRVHLENSFFLVRGPSRYAAWRAAANGGDAVAQFFVGCCYAQGAGVKEDDSAAMEWLLKAANAGNSDAMVTLANRHLLGEGTSSNPQMWFTWITRAAGANNRNAMACLGAGLFVSGNPQVQPEARRWLEKAAAAGSSDAEFFLANIAGLSPEAYTERLQKPAAAGQPDALLTLANLHPQDAESLAMAKRALQTCGMPLAVTSVIDPPPMYIVNTSGAFTRIAWERLHEMSRGGYAAADRAMAELKKKGFADPIGK